MSLHIELTVLRRERGEDSVVGPEETKWSMVNPASLLPVAKLDGQDRVFFRHWEVKLTFPVMVVTLVSIGFLVFAVAICPCLEVGVRKVSLVCVLGSLGLFLWSYFAAVLMDPGFLPFNWYKTQRMQYEWREQLSGLAVTHEQVDYALSHPRPAICSFSHSFGRFVLRGDHICSWIANWVGKRNHKQFMLLMLYGCLYTLSLAVPRFFVVAPLDRCSPTLSFFADMCCFIELMLAMILLANALTNCIQLASNRTTIETWKDIPEAEERSFREEVCGSSPIICWLCPLPAFPDDLPLPDISICQSATV